MFAALSPDHRFLSTSVVNATSTEQHFDLHVEGLRLGTAWTLWRLTGDSLTAANHVGRPSEVTIRKIVSSPSPQDIPVAPDSINIYQLPVAN